MSDPAPDASAARPRPAGRLGGGLRLTRRGRVVLFALVTVAACVLWVAAASGALATDHGASAGAARRDLSQVVVQPGQTLWSIALSTDPSADPRAVVQRIIEINGLAGGSVAAGQHLWVPRA
ncbi:MAG TPA: LysM peptidoglycan-binding domain-containing protein [Streptosporangiaceae bacterium]